MKADNTTREISEKLAVLQQQYIEQLPEKISSIESAWQELQLSSSEQLTIINKLYRQTHTLLGSSGTFGALQLSNAIKELDNFLKLIIESEQTISQEEYDVIEKLLKNIKAQSESLKILPIDGQIPSNLSDMQTLATPQSNKVYVVDDDELLTQRIVSELALINVQISTFNNTEDFLKACDEELPSLIIMDVVFPDESDNGVKAISKLKEKYHFTPPVIFISVQTNIDTRLSAVRAGAARYFNKPLDFNKLRSSVESYCVKDDEPFRVIIIDDAIVMAEYYAAILKHAGIETCTISKPLTVLDSLNDFSPDLILMDLYMPDCDGMELAAVIRQDNAYTNVPIVFLSSETDLDIQLKAIEVGAEDFIIKPADPRYLLSTVTSRIKRTRQLEHTQASLKTLMRDNEFQRIALDNHGIVSIADIDGNIIYVNEKFCKISGYSREELLGQNHRIIKSGDHSEAFYREIWQTISAGKIWSGAIKNRSKGGGYYWVESTIVPFLDEDGVPYQYISVRTDITPIMKIQEDLFDAKEQADSANRVKTQFLSNMSHELRTPLNAILGFAQLLSQDDLPDKYHEDINEIIIAGKHLLSLVNDVLDLSKIESNNLSVNLIPVKLYSVFIESYRIVHSLAVEKKYQY